MRQRDTFEQDEVSAEVKALLHRRAKRLSAPSTLEKVEALPVAEFIVGKERYALPLRSLRAVLPLTLVAPVPLRKACSDRRKVLHKNFRCQIF